MGNEWTYILAYVIETVPGKPLLCTFTSYSELTIKQEARYRLEKGMLIRLDRYRLNKLGNLINQMWIFGTNRWVSMPIAIKEKIK